VIFECNGCGERDSIVEIQLIPSIQRVSVKQDAIDKNWFKDVEYGGVTNWDEAATTLGYGCMNEKCTYWQGDYAVMVGNRHDDKNGGRFEWAPETIGEIASIVKEDA
jgi:hypothetical protein